MSSDDIMGGVAVTIIFVVIFYILYDVYKNQQGSITTYILTLAIIALTFVVLFGDWLWFRRGQQVNLLSGISGTQMGAPVQEYGGYETRYVSFERKMETHAFNNHFEHSKYYFQRAINQNIGFWGAGYNNISEQYQYMGDVVYSGGIHNAYVQIWLNFGFIPFCYYMLIVFILLFQLIKLFRNFHKSNTIYFLINTMK